MPLEDTGWRVVAYSEGSGSFASVLAGTSLTVAFSSDGRVCGSGGCNSYSGPYRLAPPSISIGPLASTRKFCASPDGVMAQESAFLAALAAAATFTTDGPKLQLWTEDGATAVELEAQRPG